MIGRIFLLVKGNAENVKAANPTIPQQYWESLIIEASSSIIDGIKSYLESGRFKEVLNFFHDPELKNSSVVNSISNKFSNRIGKFYNINYSDAIKIASALIPKTLYDLVSEANKSEKNDFNVVSILSYLNGSYVNFYELDKRMSA